MKNGVYFIVIAVLVAELLDYIELWIMDYANEMPCDVTMLTQNDAQ